MARRNYTKFGTVLEFVTDRSQEGSQFVSGFGGIGGCCAIEWNWRRGGDDEDDGADDRFEAVSDDDDFF